MIFVRGGGCEINSVHGEYGGAAVIKIVRLDERRLAGGRSSVRRLANDRAVVVRLVNVKVVVIRENHPRHRNLNAFARPLGRRADHSKCECVAINAFNARPFAVVGATRGRAGPGKWTRRK